MEIVTNHTVSILYVSFALRGMAGESDGSGRKPKPRSGLFLLARDAGVALLFVLLAILTMYAYTGLWPPLVVVESDSMMHSDENLSHIGTIDTGDLVLVKKVDAVSDVETYVDGYISGHKTYGDYGDVIIYKRDGSDRTTPIIHRAIIYLQYNSVNGTYEAPSLRDLPREKWSTSDPRDTWYRLTSMLYIYHVGWNDLTVTVDVGGMLRSHRSGFITKGDHNSATDQAYSGAGPVDISWVVGKARGEIPWFGLLKLWYTDTLGSPSPPNSVRNLWISIAVIILAPIVVDLALTFMEKRATASRREKPAHDGPPQEKARERLEGGQGGGDLPGHGAEQERPYNEPPRLP